MTSEETSNSKKEQVKMKRILLSFLVIGVLLLGAYESRTLSDKMVLFRC